MQDAPFAEASRDQSNADQRYQEGLERTGQWTMFGIPFGLERLFFSHSDYNQWKRPSQETDIYINIGPQEYMWFLCLLLGFLDKIAKCFMRIYVLELDLQSYKGFFPDIFSPSSCLAAYSVPTFSPTTSNTSRTKRLQGARCWLPVTGRSWRKAALLTQVCSQQQQRWCVQGRISTWKMQIQLNNIITRIVCASF